MRRRAGRLVYGERAFGVVRVLVDHGSLVFRVGGVQVDSVAGLEGGLYAIVIGSVVLARHIPIRRKPRIHRIPDLQ